jgi:integrase
MGTFRGKPRRNGRACGRQYLRFAICATRSKDPRGPAVGYGHVRRAKNGSPSVHPLQGNEIRALRRLQREQEASPHVFSSERGGPMTPKSFHGLFARIGERAGLPFPVHPHMLRHGCGFALANAGHDTRALQAWLGHKNSTDLQRQSGDNIAVRILIPVT